MKFRLKTYAALYLLFPLHVDLQECVIISPYLPAYRAYLASIDQLPAQQFAGDAAVLLTAGGVLGLLTK